LAGERARGKDWTKRGRRNDVRQSGADTYYFARGVPHFLLLQPRLNVTWRKNHTTTPAYHRFASVRSEETSSLSPSLNELRFVR